MTPFELFDSDDWTGDPLNIMNSKGFNFIFQIIFLSNFLIWPATPHMGIVVFLIIRWEKLKRNLEIRVSFFFWHLKLSFIFVYNINMNSWTKKHIWVWLVCMNYEIWIGYDLLIFNNFYIYIIIFMFI